MLARKVSEGPVEKMLLCKNLHSETRQAVCGVEEGNGSSIDTFRWWYPRHDEQKDFHQDEQADRNIPGFELRPSDTDLGTLAADEVDADCHCEEEQGLGIVLKVDHW
jgi:hypothetical protein